MLQIAYIRENKEDVVKRLNKKNMNAQEVVELVINLDEKRRSLQVELDNTLAESNKLSKDIGALMKSGEKAKAEILKEKSTQFREKGKELTDLLNEVALEKIFSACIRLCESINYEGAGTLEFLYENDYIKDFIWASTGPDYEPSLFDDFIPFIMSSKHLYEITSGLSMSYILAIILGITICKS